MRERPTTRKTPTKRKPTPRSTAAGPVRFQTGELPMSDVAPQESARIDASDTAERPATRSAAVLQGRDAARQGTRERRAVSARATAARPSARPAAQRDATPRFAAVRDAAGRAASHRPHLARPGIGLKRSHLFVAGLVALVVLIVAIAGLSAYCQADGNKLKHCENWRSTVRQACIDTKLDEQWVDALLALMAVESGGNVDVESVEGVAGDVMQAAEGAYGKIVKKGSKKYGVSAETPQASIYAGVLEFKQNLKLWRKYLNGIGVSETGEIQLVVQGYNFGAEGWYKWCKKRGISVYTVEAAQEYSDTKMPEDAKGTPTHAEKWLGFYEMMRG